MGVSKAAVQIKDLHLSHAHSDINRSFYCCQKALLKEKIPRLYGMLQHRLYLYLSPSLFSKALTHVLTFKHVINCN